MEKILTIIIPSYNMQDYLPQCIDSLLVSNLNMIQILIINDGSKDKTLEIASKYAHEYPDSIQVVDKPNGNYGSCINRGLTEATGKYVKVLDADDSFYKENFDDFVKFLNEVDVDLIISDYNIVDEKGAITKDVVFSSILEENRILTFENAVLPLPQNTFQMHSVTYRRENLLKLNYKQTEGISYTDQEWMFLPMLQVNKVAYFAKPLYRYLVGRSGQTVMAEKAKHLIPLSTIVKRMLEQVSHADAMGPLSLPHLSYIENRLVGLLSVIVKDSILYSNDAELYTLASEIDDYTKKVAPSVWGKLESDRIKPYIPINYIKKWRKNNHNVQRGVIKICRQLLKIYHS